MKHPSLERKAVGSPAVGFANLRRNSGSSATTTTTTLSSLNISNKLNNSSVLCLSAADSNSNNNNSGHLVGGHRKLDRSLSEPVEKSNAAQQQVQQRQNQGNSSRYKTELCRPFEESGTCKYGDKCQFAHGANELRTLARHPKYKTELCRTFHTTGFCPYGPRCHFIHNSDESRKSTGGSASGGVPPGGKGSRSGGGDQLGPRPKALSIGSFSLSSGSDTSPPSSLSESPTSMGSFFDDPFISMGGFSSTTTMSNSTPVTPTTITAANNNSSSFNFQSFPGSTAEDLLLSRKQLQQQNAYNRVWNQLSQINNPKSAAQIFNNQRNLNHLDSLDSVFRGDTPVINNGGSLSLSPDAPPSPVESVLSSDMEELSLSDSSPPCTSPLDVSRNLRLPIFSQLSND